MINPLLAVRTDFSLGESIVTIDDLPKIADRVGTDVVGLCDTMSVSALVEASKALKKANKRLVVGVRVRVIMKAEKEESACYLKLYPVNEAGVRSIYRLLSRGFQEDRFYYVPRVTWDDLNDLLDDDCLAISTGDAESVMQREDMRAALSTLCQRKRFTARFYELVPCTSPYWSRQNKLAIEWAQMENLFNATAGWEPLVVNPTLWVNEGERETFSVNAGIADKRPYEDYLRPVTAYHPLDAKELATRTVAAAAAVEKRYASGEYRQPFLAGIKNTATMADACCYTWQKQEPTLPVLAADPDEALKRLCMAGWSKRFKSPMFAHQPTPAELQQQYLPRLQFELDTLKRLGFAQYFLVVADLVSWAKQQGIYVGPGRGSVGGSLVGYLTGITDVDPIRFGLLFERFINPDRLDLPDADLDFMSARREEVIEYLIDRYTPECVAGIVNYNTMAARSAVRDVGRIYGLTGMQLDATKFVGSLHGVSQSLAEAHETSPEIQEFARQQPVVWNHALRLEGKMRAFGTHAAGVVVAGEPLTNRAVVERRGGARVINWDKRVSEEQGLIKLDVLGLTTLDMFDQAIDLIFRRHSIKLDINSIDLTDAPTLDIFSTARTAGVFQFEGGSVRRLLKEMAEAGSLTFEDLVALNALNRPGPLDAGLCESYIKRRAGTEAVTYPHPSCVPILEDTFGVIVYQEQVMQVSRVLCGFTPGEADTLRKIMGKKLPAEMAKQRDKFVDGAVATSQMDPAKADALFTMIEGFAGYAFNRSHAVEYTLIAFQAAYLKAHYLVEFYTASMGIADEEKLAGIAKQAKQDGIRVIPPDINVSTHRFEPLNDTIIAAPLSAVKNVSEKGAAAIVAARTNPNPVLVEETSGRGKAKQTVQKTYGPGRFVSMEDFIARVPAKAVNARAREHLDRVGAFARIVPGQLPSTHPSRQRDQIELMPAISDQGVVADRKVLNDEFVGDQICDVMDDMEKELGGSPVPCHLGKNPKMMFILDAPFNDYETLTRQYSFTEFVAPSLNAAGLTADDAVWSWCMRRPARKGERDFPPEELTKHLLYLKREIAIMKPPVIVLLGPTAIRQFFPDIKQLGDHIGRKSFSANLDATVIVGFKPTQIYHDASKADTLRAIFEEAKKLVEETA